MKITTHYPQITQNIAEYVRYGLDGADYDHDGNSFEAAKRGITNAHESLGRLLTLLATKGLVSAPEITYVVRGFEDEDAEFTDDSVREGRP